MVLCQWRRIVDWRLACFAVSADGLDELFRIVKKKKKERKENISVAVEFVPWQYVVSRRQRNMSTHDVAIEVTAPGQLFPL